MSWRGCPLVDIYEANARAIAAARERRDTSTDPRWAWPSLTKVTGTLGPGQLWVLAGRPGNGKTAVLLNLADQWLREGIPWVYAGLEMSDGLLVSCLAALRCNLARFRVIEQEMTPAEEKAHAGEIDKLEDAGDSFHFIPCESLTVEDFVAFAIEAVHAIKAKVVVLDHLHHLTYQGKDMRVEVSRAVRLIKTAAEITGVPFIVACQLKRTGNRLARWGVPELEELKETGAIEEMAHAVVFVHRMVMPGSSKAVRAYMKGEGSPQDFEHLGRIALTQQKHRGGRDVGRTVPLKIHWPTDRITELEDEVVSWGSDADAERETK